MVTVKKVEGKRDVKRFVEFPLKLYKNCPYFVPPIYADEKKLIASGANSDNYESVFFLAERDGEVVGRIHGILQKQYNEKNGERRIRFTRFDSINDKEVSRALFAALENWGRERNMTELCGPLGFSDLDREGLLIEGFSEDSTFEEQYNYEYYAELIEDVGLKKEVDWLEFELKAPEKKNEMLRRVAQRTLELHRLHVVDPNMPKKEYIAKYGDGFFTCLDECYKKLYGTVPISEEQKKELISQFMLIINPKYLVFICDEKEKVVAFGLCFPAIGEALKKSGGRLTPLALIKLLRLARKPKSIDLGLVAVLPEYQNTGVNAVLVNGIVEMLSSGEIEKCETNLNLETNTQVMAQWKYMSQRQHKRRRSYVKNIERNTENA